MRVPSMNVIVILLSTEDPDAATYGERNHTSSFTIIDIKRILMLWIMVTSYTIHRRKRRWPLVIFSKS